MAMAGQDILAAPSAELASKEAGIDTASVALSIVTGAEGEGETRSADTTAATSKIEDERATEAFQAARAAAAAVTKKWDRRGRNLSIGNFTSPTRKSAFWFVLLLIAVFAGVPAMQYTLKAQSGDDVTSNTCHFNNRCRRDVTFLGWIKIKAFNNVISNLGYTVCGLILIAWVALDSKVKAMEPAAKSGRLRYQDPAMFYAIGIAVVCEGFFSACYHMCPTLIFFQFDTIFMFFCAGVFFATIYARRHGNTAFRPSSFFTFFALVVSANAIGIYLVMNDVYVWFWVVIIVGYTAFAFYLSMKL